MRAVNSHGESLSVLVWSLQGWATPYTCTQKCIHALPHAYLTTLSPEFLSMALSLHSPGRKQPRALRIPPQICLPQSMRHSEYAFCCLPPHCCCLIRRMFPPSSPAPLILYLHASLTSFLYFQHEPVTRPINPLLALLSSQHSKLRGAAIQPPLADTTHWVLHPLSRNSGVWSTLDSRLPGHGDWSS